MVDERGFGVTPFVPLGCRAVSTFPSTPSPVSSILSVEFGLKFETLEDD